MSSARFSRLENLIEHLLEERLTRLFEGRLQPSDLASRLTRAMQDNLRADGNNAVAPTNYAIILNTEDHEALLRIQPDLAEVLATVITRLAAQAKCRLPTPPIIHLRTDDAFMLRQVNVLAWHEQSTERHATAIFAPTDAPSTPEEHGLRNPQLIIQGTQFVPLTRPIVTIGRRRDNHIVIDAPTVSRAHAQLRLRFGKYVIYDLGSTAGTFVNEKRISEAVLNPGDVISIGNTLIVYVEDDGTTSRHVTEINEMRMDDTQSMSPGEGE